MDVSRINKQACHASCWFLHLGLDSQDNLKICHMFAWQKVFSIACRSLCELGVLCLILRSCSLDPEDFLKKLQNHQNLSF